MYCSLFILISRSAPASAVITRVIFRGKPSHRSRHVDYGLLQNYEHYSTCSGIYNDDTSTDALRNVFSSRRSHRHRHRHPPHHQIVRP